MRTLIASVLFAAILSSACAAQERYAPLNRPLQIEKAPQGQVYYSIGSPGVPGPANQGNTSNAGFVITAEGVVVYDALGTPSLGDALVDEVWKRTDKPIRYVVVGHYHADHIYGLQAIKTRFPNATIIAQERASDYQEDTFAPDERAGARLEQRRSALFPWVNENTRVVRPDITFRERASIRLGDHRFQLVYAGPAHSSNDLMMMVEPERVLFAGDIVQSGRIPFMNSDDVSTSRWLSALADVKTLNPSFIIPGHGTPSARADEAISFTSTYIRYVRRLMGEAVQSWTDFDAAYGAADWSAYAKLPAFEANNRGNAYRIYLELETAKQPADSPDRPSAEP